jgi:hypothetical protein
MAEGDRVLTVQFTLEVHVSVRNCQLLLDSDQVDVEVLAPKSSLQLNPSGVRCSLDVLEDGFLHLVHVTLLRGRLQFSPCLFSRDIFDIRPIDLAVAFAVLEDSGVRKCVLDKTEET